PHAKKLLRKKKNESWTMRPVAEVCDSRNNHGLTSPTLGVGGNLLCKIVQFVSLRIIQVVHASHARDRRATQSCLPRFSSLRVLFALARNRRLLLRQAKRRLSKLSLLQRVSTSRSIYLQLVRA